MESTTATSCGSSNDEKIQAFRDLLKEKPKNARATSQLACMLAEKAKLEAKRNDTGKKTADTDADELLCEAVELARSATQLAPRKPFGFAALSNILSNFDERMKNLRQAIELSTDPQHIFARIDLLVRLLLEPRIHEAKKVEAEGNIGSANSQHPSKRDLSPQEGVLYLTIRDALQEAWEQDNLSSSNIDFLAKTEYRLGSFFRRKRPLKVQQTRSKLHFTRALENIPPSNRKHSLAQFWLATLSSNNSNTSKSAMKRCPKEYVVGLYSTFAARFDNLLLESLKYVTPVELRRLVDTVVGQTQKRSSSQQWAQKGADLGCGTGLSGESFRDCVKGHFLGVDLSPEMLAKARLRSCYDELVEGDCISVLDGQADLDLIIACDVFVYIGDLKETFEAAYISLSQDGIFAFSTELMDEAAGSFVLHECARFAHTKAYINDLAMGIGFQICGHKVCPIRKNEGKDVQGSLVVLSK